MNARRAFKVPDFALFKFDVDNISVIYATRTIIDGDFVKGGRGKVNFKGKVLDGTILALGGKFFIFPLFYSKYCLQIIPKS